MPNWLTFIVAWAIIAATVVGVVFQNHLPFIVNLIWWAAIVVYLIYQVPKWIRHRREYRHR